MSITPDSASSAPQAPRADAEPIDWDNVAVETEVMLRLQQAPPIAGARAGAQANRAEAKGR